MDGDFRRCVPLPCPRKRVLTRVLERIDVQCRRRLDSDTPRWQQVRSLPREEDRLRMRQASRRVIYTATVVDDLSLHVLSRDAEHLISARAEQKIVSVDSRLTW